MAVLDELGITRVVLVGHDASGPDAVASLSHIRNGGPIWCCSTLSSDIDPSLRLPKMIRLLADPTLTPLADGMVNDDGQRLWLLQHTADHWGLDALDPDILAVLSIPPRPVERRQMKAPQIDYQYSTGLSRHNIEQALIAAGRDLYHLQPADLGALEDVHTLGRIATSRLAELAEINSHDEVLDAGSGIVGTVRFLASQYGCKVTAIDLTEEYCETARWLNRLIGLDDRISVRQGDVTDLPFAQASFDVVISQHVQMNVSDKTRLYQQARRVLVTGGRLAIWEVTAGTAGNVDYPLPWADQPELGHLASADQLRAVIDAAGFTVVHWNDLTEPAVSLMESFLSAPPGLIGLHAFIDNFAEKANNLTRGLSSGRLRVIQGVARAQATAGARS